MRVILSMALMLLATGVSGMAQDILAPSAPSTNVLLWPTMNYTNFLAGHPNEARRQHLWNYFLLVEREAKSFAGTENHWTPIKTAVLGKGIPIYVSTGLHAPSGSIGRPSFG